MATLFLFRFRARNDPPMSSSPTPCPYRRAASPWPGRSILMTSAPMSPRICVLRGPAKMCVKSTTRTPSSRRLVTLALPARLRRLQRLGAGGVVQYGGVLVAGDELARIGLAHLDRQIEVDTSLLLVPPGHGPRTREFGPNRGQLVLPRMELVMDPGMRPRPIGAVLLDQPDLVYMNERRRDQLGAELGQHAMEFLCRFAY